LNKGKLLKTYSVTVINVVSVYETIPHNPQRKFKASLDEKPFIQHKEKTFPLQESTKLKGKVTLPKQKASSEKFPCKPAANHPWQQCRASKKLQ